MNIKETLIEHGSVPNNMIWDQINNHKFWMELWVANGKHSWNWFELNTKFSCNIFKN
jgi:hypothetical protein